MVEKPDILATEKENGIPNRAQWLNNLIQPYEDSILKRAKNYFYTATKDKGPYSISKWKQIMGTSKNDGEGGKQFLENLKQWNALRDKGTENQGNRYYPVYKLDEEKLVKAFYHTKFYKENRDAFIKAINQEENKIKVVNDY